MVAATRTNERHDVVALRRHPGNRSLCHADAPRSSNRAQGFDQREIGVDIRALETRAVSAEVVRASRALAPMAADEPAREHAVSRDADTKRTARWQDLVLDAARDERIFNLQIADRMHGRGAPQRQRANFGQADVPHTAGLHHVGDRTDRFFDRDVRLNAGWRREVEVYGAEPLQRIGEIVLHRPRPSVVTRPATGGIAQRAELDAHDDLVAGHTLERLADQELVVAHAVEITGIKERDVGLERGMDGGDTLRPVRQAVHSRHAHTAKAAGGNLGTFGPELAILHVQSSMILSGVGPDGWTGLWGLASRSIIQHYWHGLYEIMHNDT